jgi:hypothetical protein
MYNSSNLFISTVQSTVKPEHNNYLWNPKLWPLLTGVSYSEAAYFIQIVSKPLKLWLLKVGGGYSEVVVRLRLTFTQLVLTELHDTTRVGNFQRL